MAITPNTFNNLSSALIELGLLAITEDEANAIVDTVGLRPLQDLFSQARAGEGIAKVQIHQTILAAKASSYLTQTGKADATLPVAIVLVNAHGYPKVRELMVKSAEGDANASTIIDKWIERALHDGQEQGGVEQLGDPLHETDVPPPNDHRPVQTQRTQQQPSAQRAQPAQRPAAQAYRADDSNGAARTPATRSATVTRLPSNPASHSGDEETSQRFAPADTGGGQADRDNGARGNAQGQGNAQSGARRYDQHSCYGRDTAVTFERTPNQRRDNNTVNFKIAKAMHQGKTCKEGVDWQNAIIMMLEPHEVQIVYAVLMGIGQKCRFAGHGRDNQKWFEVEETSGDYAGAVRLTVGHGREDIRRINISHTDIKEVLEIFSRTLQDQGKGLSPVFMLAEVRRVYDLYIKKEDAKGSRQPRAQAGRG